MLCYLLPRAAAVRIPSGTIAAPPECRRRSAVGLGAMADTEDLYPIAMMVKAHTVVAEPQTKGRATC